MTKAEASTAFLAKWIPYGKHLMNRAEAHGVDWKNIHPEKLLGAIIAAEEFAMPDEYKRNPYQGDNNTQKRIIARS